MIYQRGTAINLVQDFWTIDPITLVSTPADPTTVVFKILSPDGVTTTYTFGPDANVTNPAVGTFVCALDPQLPVGTYRYRCDGTGAVVASSEDQFEVIESGVLPPDPSTVATAGPCSSWINGDDVAACGPELGVGSDHWLLDDVAYMASYLLFELSGRQYPGVCQRTVRPCRDTCGCWGASTSSGISPLYWWGLSSYAGTYGWGWWSEGGDTCGCGTNSYVKLAGYPVRDVSEVKIDGAVLPEIDVATGAPNYRLDGRRNLIRMSTPGTPPVANAWPACQDLSLEDDQPGTFAITYTWGMDVPALGQRAATQLARELFQACSGETCALPTKVTKIARQGIAMERVVPMADLLRSGSTGLQLVDAFIAASNPTKMRRRPAVWSPDVQEYARKVGQ